MESPTLAIDFGTSRTKVAFYDEASGKAQLVEIGREIRTVLPSVFYIPKEGQGERLVGDDAQDMVDSDPDGIVLSLKKELHKLGKKRCGPDRPAVERIQLASDLFAHIYQRCRTEVFFNEAISNCRLTVPVDFKAQQREAIRSAAQLGGFQEVTTVEEPVAAAQHWLLGLPNDKFGDSVVVCDVGGGTTDFAFLRYIGGRFQADDQVLSAGFPIGGNDLDELIWERICEDDPVMEQNSAQASGYLIKIRRERELMTKTRRPEIRLTVDGRHCVFPRTVIEASTSEFIERVKAEALRFLERIGEQTTITDAPILLVGGASRLRGLQEALKALQRGNVYLWNDCDYATVLGAVEIPNAPPTRLRNHEARSPATLGAVDRARTATPKSSAIFSKEDVGQAKILGIDFGTANSSMAIMDNGNPMVLENSEGKRSIPSYVAFTNPGECLVGDAAKRQAVTNPRNTISSINRFMGRKFDEVQGELKNLPYHVVSGPNGDAVIEVYVDGKPKQFNPPDIAGYILRKLKLDAEAQLGAPIEHAVISVPASFNYLQRQATIAAGRLAGLEFLRIINEPTAASLAYGRKTKKEGKIAVYDLGAGTFGISVLEIGDGVFEVKATNGDTHLGGDDWDNAVMDWLRTEFEAETGIDLKGQPDAIQRLKEESEKAKIALSSSQTYEINLPFIVSDQTGPKHIHKDLTRAKLEQLTDALTERTIKLVNACLADANLNTSQIDEFVLVGGMTRMPRIVDVARNLVGKEPHQGINPDEVVAIGAAIHGGVLKGDVKDVLLLDVTPLTLAIETAGSVATPMIPRNSTIPTKKSQTFSTYSDNQTGIEINLVQGEHPLARNNKQLGTIHLDGIPPAPRGDPQIEVIFDIDSNGILHVSAKELGTGMEFRRTIPASTNLSKQEVTEMRGGRMEYYLSKK